MVRSRSVIAIPPGETIKEQLIDRGMSQKEFAVRMDMTEKHISKLVNGEVQLTPDVSVRLETVLGVPAKFWNNLEASYREKLVKVKNENEMEADLEISKRLPYAEMAKFGWVPETRNPQERVERLRRYFEIVKLYLLDNHQISKIACRRLAITEKSDLAVLAWAQEARIESRKIETSKFDRAKLMNAISEIRKMTTKKPEFFCEKLVELLAECGVALVFLPHLKGSYLQGASFLDGNHVVIGMTLRGKDSDKFWFSLFHELGHIMLNHLVEEGTREEDEIAADEWASEALIRSVDMDLFVRQGVYTPSSIKEFAQSLDIAPGIVVGRLQYLGKIGYDRLNTLKEKYIFEV